jgi:SAM-dependent methyltransferase
MLTALRVYDDGLARGHDEVVVRLSDGTLTELALRRYLSAADEIDHDVLSRAIGPVLDVGCGPGRHLHALAQRGVFALGVDLSSIAVMLARGGGGRAIVGSIFDHVPAAGSWRTALLLDGNIGIGGAPTRLLNRLRTLLSDDGELLVELDPAGSPTARLRARLEVGAGVSDWFPWARVGFDGIGVVASNAGFTLHERWCEQGRWFARLAARPPGRPAAG